MALDILSAADLRVLHSIRDMPLATLTDLEWSVAGVTGEELEEGIGRLRDAGLVTTVAAGFLGPMTERFHLTEYAQSELEIRDASWNQPGCLMRLLERLPAVEWLYQAAAHITNLGACQEFQWLDAVAFDAAVRYEDGWVALFWVGLLRSEKLIADRFKDLGRDLDNLACVDTHPRPGLLCCVVIDQWEAELVRRVACRLMLDEWVGIWCIKDGSWHGAASPTHNRGWVRQPAYQRKDTWDAWRNRVRQSWFCEEGNSDPREILRRVRPALREAMGNRHAADRWVTRARRELREVKDAGAGAAISWLWKAQNDLKENGGFTDAAAIIGRVAGYLRDHGPPADTARALLGVTEWPGMSTSMAQGVLGEGPTGRRAQRALVRMADWGILQRWREGKRMRYRTTWAAFKVLAAMDRTNPESLWKAIQMNRWEAGGRFEVHEYGVMDVAAQFLAVGCPVAAGWRDNEPMGYSGGIVPDWMVLLSTTPFLPGWHYGEYERSARDPNPVTRKLRGFDSLLRVNGWPVLVVSASDQAEEVFHRVGGGMGLQMLTTTIDRARKHGVAGVAGCWRLPEYLGGSFFLDPGEQPALG